MELKHGDIVEIDGTLFELREFVPTVLIVPRNAQAQLARVANKPETATATSDPPEERPPGEAKAADETDDSAESPQVSEPAGGGGGGGGEGASENTNQEKSAVDSEATPSTENSDTAAGQPRPDPESNGSDRNGAAGDQINKRELSKRVAEHLKSEKLTQKAFGDMAGVHHTAVSCLVRCVYVGPGDLKKMSDFVDALDADDPEDIDESMIEVLPNRYDELNSGNPLPRPEPPPRCAKAP